jgi:hypothetical protein
MEAEAKKRQGATKSPFYSSCLLVQLSEIQQASKPTYDSLLVDGAFPNLSTPGGGVRQPLAVRMTHNRYLTDTY